MQEQTETIADTDTRPAQVRITRPSRDLRAVEHFYCELVGATRLTGFDDHAGYSGVMVGFPDSAFHIEFVAGTSMGHAPKPTPEDALVLYYPDTEGYRRVTERLAAAGIKVVNTENPYWHGISTCYSDPDGYLLIIANTKGIGL